MNIRDQEEPFDWQIEGDIFPLADRVLVCGMEHGETLTRGGLIIPNADSSERGIKPRWCNVYSVGKNVTDIKKGDLILVSHGRWSRGVKVKHNGTSTVVRMVEVESILGVMDSSSDAN